jgi:hypothetical protein
VEARAGVQPRGLDNALVEQAHGLALCLNTRTVASSRKPLACWDIPSWEASRIPADPRARKAAYQHVVDETLRDLRWVFLLTGASPTGQVARKQTIL